MERAATLTSVKGFYGMIVPLTSLIHDGSIVGRSASVVKRAA
jgi:hypothetical protein